MKQQNRHQQVLPEEEMEPQKAETETIIPDLSDPDEAAKAFIASEIFNRKY